MAETWRSFAIFTAWAIIGFSAGGSCELLRANRIRTGCGWLLPPPRGQVPIVCAKDGAAANSVPTAMRTPIFFI